MEIDFIAGALRVLLLSITKYFNFRRRGEMNAALCQWHTQLYTVYSAWGGVVLLTRPVHRIPLGLVPNQL